MTVRASDMMMTRQALAAVLLVLLSATGLRADDAEDRAIRAINKLGGRFTRDDKTAAKAVVAVTLYGFEVTDATLKELKGLTSLETLQGWTVS